MYALEISNRFENQLPSKQVAQSLLANLWKKNRVLWMSWNCNMQILWDKTSGWLSVEATLEDDQLRRAWDQLISNHKSDWTRNFHGVVVSEILDGDDIAEHALLQEQGAGDEMMLVAEDDLEGDGADGDEEVREEEDVVRENEGEN